jgi:adhesin transport system outer membrane protein
MIGRLGIVSSLALVAAMTVNVAPVQAESLSEEIAFLLRDNPELKSLRNQVEASEEGINEAFAGYLPRVELTGDFGQEYTDGPTVTDLSGDPLDLTRSRATATLRQNLFNGYGTDAAYGAAQVTRDISELSLEDDTQSLILEGVRAYLDVLRAIYLIDYSERNVDTIATQLNLENERVERGSGLALDVLQAKTRLQLAEERRVAFEGRLQEAIARYNMVFGHPPELGTMELPRIPEDELPSNLDEAVAIALSENPEIATSDAVVELADERRNQASAAYWPTIDLVGILDYEDNVDGVQGVQKQGTIMVEANWQLFSGFANQARVAQSAYEHVAAIHDRSSTMRLIVQDVEVAWDQVMTSRQRVDLLKNAVNIAIEVHESRVRLRDAGQETVLNVLDAENDVFNAQINLVSAQYDGYLGIFRLMEAMGRLTPERLVPGYDEQSSIGVDEDDISLAATVDQQTVDLVTQPLQVAQTEADAPSATFTYGLGGSLPVVQIAASSDPYVWSQAEGELPFNDTTGTMTSAGDPTTQQAGMFAMAQSIQSFKGEMISIARSASPTNEIQEAFDPNLIRAWSFE